MAKLKLLKITGVPPAAVGPFIPSAGQTVTDKQFVSLTSYSGSMADKVMAYTTAQGQTSGSVTDRLKALSVNFLDYPNLGV